MTHRAHKVIHAAVAKTHFYFLCSPFSFPSLVLNSAPPSPFVMYWHQWFFHTREWNCALHYAIDTQIHTINPHGYFKPLSATILYRLLSTPLVRLVWFAPVDVWKWKTDLNPVGCRTAERSAFSLTSILKTSAIRSWKKRSGQQWQKYKRHVCGWTLSSCITR